MLPFKNWIHLSKWSQPELCYCSHWGVRGKPHEPALLGSRLGGQSHTNSLCQISLLVLFCLSGIHSVFPPLFSSRKYSAWNWTFCEMAMVLTRKAIIYKIRVKSVKMDWLEKNVLWLDIRMSEYLLQCDCHLLFIRKLPETHIKKEYVFILCFIFMLTLSFWNNCSNSKPWPIVPFVLHYVLSQFWEASFTNQPLPCQGASAEGEDAVLSGFEVQPTEEKNIILLGFHCILQAFQVQNHSACELFF